MNVVVHIGFILLFNCGLVIFRICYGWPYNASDEKNLFKHLFSDYFSYVVPREVSSVPLYVSIKPSILFLDEVNVKSQTYTARIFFELTWKDTFLTWEPGMFSGLEKIIVPYNMIWTPDICIAGSVGDYTDIGQERTAAIVYNTGYVIFWPIKVFEITCVVDISKYPFDEHSCEIDLSSWTLDDTFVQMVAANDSINLSMLTPSGEWEVNSELAYYRTYPYGGLGYSHVIFPFKIRRRWQFIILNRFFPTLCTSLLTLLCFCLPKESGERVSLSISIFLSLAVFMTVTSQDLPETADAVSLLGAYVALQLAWSGMTIMLTVASLVIAFKDNNLIIPKWLQILVRLCKSSQGLNAATGYETDHNESKIERKMSVEYRTEDEMFAVSNQDTNCATWSDVASLFNTTCFFGSVAFQICLNLWFLIRSVQ